MQNNSIQDIFFTALLFFARNTSQATGHLQEEADQRRVDIIIAPP